jgi:hypothetical protein
MSTMATSSLVVKLLKASSIADMGVSVAKHRPRKRSGRLAMMIDIHAHENKTKHTLLGHMRHTHRTWCNGQEVGVLSGVHLARTS